MSTISSISVSSAHGMDESTTFHSPELLAGRANSWKPHATKPKTSSRALSIDARQLDAGKPTAGTSTALLERLAKEREINGAPFSEIHLWLNASDGYIYMQDGQVNLAWLARWMQARNIMKPPSTLIISTGGPVESLNGVYHDDISVHETKYNIAQRAATTGTKIVLKGEGRTIIFTPSAEQLKKVQLAAARAEDLVNRVARQLGNSFKSEEKLLVRECVLSDAMFNRSTRIETIVDVVRRFSELPLEQKRLELNDIYLR
ncbi:hypothetical protein SAMN06265795_103286 [Noviherbaspirillum humi]|uniref:Uncharacterized protein n=1 Tax=Noviherbaspirillum humi TaxID=1688639 RepID=A0A239FDH1_9BURK|nr:hypothetical protein [Noviherbaspirillum humi]SNS54343.1 hypothetical protein SAMN06265795_103286 [Noviherbaspirillum humi]